MACLIDVGKSYLQILYFAVFLQNCALWEETGAPGWEAVSGKDAKAEISKATLEAVATGQLLWLSQNGMQAGPRFIGFLAYINGFLVSFLQPILSEIPDREFYTQTSLNRCTRDIRGQAALLYGSFLDSLPPGGFVSASARDAILIPTLASCKLEKTGKILHVPNLINF